MCQHLHELTLRGSTFRDHIAGQQAACLPKWLQHLRRLSSYYTDAQEVIAALAPQLTYLHYEDEIVDGDDHSIDPSILESCNQLTSVTLKQPSCNTEHIKALVSCPRLQHVSLRRVADISTNFADAPCSWKALKITKRVHVTDLLHLPVKGLGKLQLGGLCIDLPVPSHPTNAATSGTAAHAAAAEAAAEVAAAQAAAPVEAAVRVITGLASAGPGCFSWTDGCMELAFAVKCDSRISLTEPALGQMMCTVACAAASALQPLGSLASSIKLTKPWSKGNAEGLDPEPDMSEIAAGSDWLPLEPIPWMITVLHVGLGSLVRHLDFALHGGATSELWHSLHTCLPGVSTLIVTMCGRASMTVAPLAFFCAGFPRPLELSVRCSCWHGAGSGPNNSAPDAVLREVKDALEKQQVASLVRINTSVMAV